MDNIANKELDQEIQALMESYDKTYQILAARLKIALDFAKNQGFKKITLNELYRLVDLLFAQLDRQVSSLSKESLNRAITQGFADSLLAGWGNPKDQFSITKAFAEASNMVNQQLLNKADGELSSALFSANNNAKNAVNSLIQRTFSEHMQAINLLNRGQSQMAQLIIDKLSGDILKNNINASITGIVDSAGRRWNLQTYVDMAVTTMLQKAYVDGLKDYARFNEGKGDLVLIPVLGVDNPCRFFEGMIISISGFTEGYKTYDELQATGMIFHPRCRHTPIPYYDLSEIPEEVKAQQGSIIRRADDFLNSLK